MFRSEQIRICIQPHNPPQPVSVSISKTKQPAPPLPKRINDQRAHKQPHRNPNRNLNHAIRDVQNPAVDIDARIRSGVRNDRPRRPIDRLVRKLVGGREPADQTAPRGEARRHLHEDGREQGGSRQAVAETAVEVPDDADGEGAERVGDLGVGGEALGGEMVDDVAGEGDDEHDGHLLGAAVVDEDEAEGEGGHEDELEPDGHAGPAGGVVGGVAVDGAVDGGADGDAEAEEQGVDDGVDHADGAGDHVAGLEFE